MRAKEFTFLVPKITLHIDCKKNKAQYLSGKCLIEDSFLLSVEKIMKLMPSYIT